MFDPLTLDKLPISEIAMTLPWLRESGGSSMYIRDSLTENQELCGGLMDISHQED